MTASGRSDAVGLGIALVLAVSLIFALSDSAAKRAVATLDPLLAMWIRSVVVLSLTLPIVLWRRGSSVIRSTRPGRQFARGLLAFGASILFLTGLRSLGLADATAINFVWPMLVTILSMLVLGERVGVRRALATLAGFAGMLIIVRPGSAAFQAAALYPLLGAACWASASIMTRVISGDDRPETTILWSALVALAGSTAALPLVWRTPDPDEFVFAALLGLGSATSHAMLVVAYGRAPASTLAPYSYAQLVFAAICGYLFFGALPDRWIVLGSAIIVASGLYTIHRERIRSLER